MLLYDLRPSLIEDFIPILISAQAARKVDSQRAYFNATFVVGTTPLVAAHGHDFLWWQHKKLTKAHGLTMIDLCDGAGLQSRMLKENLGSQREH